MGWIIFLVEWVPEWFVKLLAISVIPGMTLSTYFWWTHRAILKEMSERLEKLEVIEGMLEQIGSSMPTEKTSESEWEVIPNSMLDAIQHVMRPGMRRKRPREGSS